VTLLATLLPDGVQAEEIFELPAELDLLPEELAVVARAVDKRRREFAAARRCARAALGRLGVPPVAILPGERGAPTWPAGITGSMTHCVGYAAAAVAPSGRTATLGIDAEPDAPLPHGVLDTIALDAEKAQLARLLADRPDVSWDRLLFCAKEAVYKSWFPLARRWLGFEEALVTLDADGGFAAELLVPGPDLDGRPVRGFEGRWTAGRGLLLTAIAVPRRG